MYIYLVFTYTYKLVVNIFFCLPLVVDIGDAAKVRSANYKIGHLEVKVLYK